ncbi:MAG: diguanylate cyclase [Candidatus Brocadiales bacterium]|nr:diguanylate cyclase [Candidatus Bathyanammoxibius amoris]
MVAEKVLIIDDEESIQKALSLVLKGEGYNVSVSGTGNGGLEKLANEKFDAVFLDYKLLDTDGLNVAKTIRNTDSQVAIIFITAYSSIDTALTVMKLGAFDFLEKPLQKDNTLASLRRALLTKKFLEKGKHALERPNILVVDDEHVVRLGLEESLKGAGYYCKSCSSGYEAVRKVEEELFNIIIVDLKLGDMEGTELVRRVREHFPEMMAIVMTGMPSIDSAVMAMKSGSFDYITKPLDTEDVIGRIKLGWEKYRQGFLLKQLLHNLQAANLELEKANQKLNALSVTDGLTLLYNHRYILDTLEIEYQKARRFQKPLSLIMLDLDHFKTINDTYGHQGGDKVLVKFGSFLKEHLRTIDIVGRYGGEEFCAILPETDTAGAVVIAEKLRQAVSERTFVLDNEIKVHVTASFGVSCIQDAGVDCVDTLLGHADSALYEAKLRGRNRVVCWAEIHKKPEAPASQVAKTAVADYERYASSTAKDLKSSYVQSVKALVNALEAKDGYTATHSYLVSYYAGAVARHQKLSDEEVDVIATAGLLHDIGKIGIPDGLLKKEGALTKEETAVVRKHPEAGAKILGPMGFLQRELELIHFHQERWDGLGYPYGIKENNIPFGARLLAICDAFEAMTSERPYRKKPLTAREALEEIERIGGKQIDPTLVAPFVKGIKELLSKEKKIYLKDLNKTVLLPQL